MSFALPHTKPVFKQKADATYAGTPASGVAEDVLTTTKNVRIISITCTPAFTGGTTHLAEIHVTIDGQTITYTVAPTTATPYFATPDSDATPTAQLLSATDRAEAGFLLEGRSVAVTFELTTDGTPGACTARVKYAKME